MREGESVFQAIAMHAFPVSHAIVGNIIANEGLKMRLMYSLTSSPCQKRVNVLSSWSPCQEKRLIHTF